MTESRLTPPATDDQIIDRVLAAEGRDVFTDRADDAGGATRWGITLERLSEWRRHPCTAADVAALTEVEAREIYRHAYIGAPGFGALTPLQLRWLVVDCGVLHGPGRAARWLQHALGVKEDGDIGSVSLSALAQADWRLVYLRICDQPIDFIGEIVTGNLRDQDHDGVPDNTEMCKGWLRRATGFLEGAA